MVISRQTELHDLFDKTIENILFLKKNIIANLITIKDSTKFLYHPICSFVHFITIFNPLFCTPLRVNIFTVTSRNTVWVVGVEDCRVTQYTVYILCFEKNFRNSFFVLRK